MNAFISVHCRIDSVLFFNYSTETDCFRFIQCSTADVINRPSSNHSNDNIYKRNSDPANPTAVFAIAYRYFSSLISAAASFTCSN